MSDRTRETELLPADSGGHGPHLVFRRAGLDDYSTIRHVQAAAVRSLNGKFLDLAEVSAAAATIYTSGYITELFSKTVFVALLNGDIVATSAWNPSDDRGSAARISALFVSPLFQGTGVGRKLVTVTENDAAQNGYARFTATAPVSVLPLFLALGYGTASFGTSRDVVPATSIQVAFLRKPG